MSTISPFLHITLDGYFAGPNGEIDWFKSIAPAKDFEAYTHEQSSGGSTLLFGRTTYEMMKSFWPTEEARRSDPALAEGKPLFKDVRQMNIRLDEARSFSNGMVVLHYSTADDA